MSTGGMLPPSRDCAVKLERLSAARKRAALARSSQVRPSCIIEIVQPDVDFVVLAWTYQGGGGHLHKAI